MSLSITYSDLFVSSYDTNSVELKVAATFNNAFGVTLNTTFHIGYFRITLSRNSDYSSPWYFRCDPTGFGTGTKTLYFSNGISTSTNRTVLNSFSHNNGLTYHSENSDLDIYDTNRGNLLASNQSGGTIYYKIEVMKKASHAVYSNATRQGSFTLPPIFEFNAYTEFTNNSQTHTNDILNYQASWEGSNANSVYKDMRIKVKRITTNGGNTMVAGTSEISFTDTNNSLRSTSDSDVNNILSSQLFPDGTYESDETYYFRYTLEALGSNGTILDTDTGSFSKKVFPKLLCRPGSKISSSSASAGSPVDNSDQYALVDNSGDVLIGLRYALQFRGQGTFSTNDGTSAPVVDIYKGNSGTPLQQISLDGSNIGTGALDTPELYYYDNWGTPYAAGLQGTFGQGDYKAKVSYKARSGNITITNNNSGKYSIFDVDLPYHRLPITGFEVNRMLHVNDSGTEKLKLSFVDGNGDSDSSVVSLTNMSSEFNYSFAVRETVINSITASNIGDQSSVISFSSKSAEVSGEAGNFYSVAWTPSVSDEIYYIARFEVEFDFYYDAPNDSNYTTWRNRLVSEGYTVPAPGTSDVNIGSFTDNSDGLNLTYQALLVSNPSLANTFNGVYMNSGSSRVDTLIPSSATKQSISSGAYALSGNRCDFYIEDDPSDYYSNSTPKFAFGVKVKYRRKDNGAIHYSNIVVYNALGEVLGVSTAVNGNSQTQSSINNLVSKRNKLSDLRDVSDYDSGIYNVRRVDFDINYENSLYNFVGGLDTDQQIQHTIYYYIEEEIDSVLDTYWDEFLTQAQIDELNAQGLSGMVYLDGSRDYRYPEGWRVVMTDTNSKTLSSLLSSHNHITSNSGVPTVEGFAAMLNPSSIGSFETYLDYDSTSNSKLLPFSHSEEVVGVSIGASQVDSQGATLLDLGSNYFYGNNTDWGSDVSIGGGANSSNRYTFDRVFDLDIAGFDVQKDNLFAITPFITTRTSFDGTNNNISNETAFTPITDYSIPPDGGGSNILGKTVVKNYESEIVPTFSEIEFITPVDNTPSDAAPLTALPQVDVFFKYNPTSFASSEGDYFNISRENIRIERTIIQGGVEYVPTNEQSRINDGDIYSIPNTSDGNKNLFTFDDTFSHSTEANDIAATGIDTNSVYVYRYTLIPGFVYNPGGGGEKRIEFTSIGNNSFDIIPENLTLSLGLVENLQSFYNPGHSQEIAWEYTYGEATDFLRGQGDSISFDVYYRVKEDNQLKDSGEEIKYKRKELDSIKGRDWIHSKNISWDLSSLSEANLEDTFSFSHVMKYDKFYYNHRIEIAVLLKIEGGFSLLSQSLQSHTGGGINTIGMATNGAKLEPSRFMKKRFLLSDADKISFTSRKFHKVQEEFALKENLEQVPFSVATKKAKTRNSNKPYSSST